MECLSKYAMQVEKTIAVVELVDSESMRLKKKLNEYLVINQISVLRHICTLNTMRLSIMDHTVLSAMLWARPPLYKKAPSFNTQANLLAPHFLH